MALVAFYSASLSAAAKKPERDCAWSILSWVGQVLGVPKNQNQAKKTEPVQEDEFTKSEVGDANDGELQDDNYLREKPAAVLPSSWSAPFPDPPALTDAVGPTKKGKEKKEKPKKKDDKPSLFSSPSDTEEKAAKMRTLLSTPSRQADALRDFLNFSRVKSIVRNHASVSVLFGDPQNRLNLKDLAFSEQYAQFIRRLIDAKVVILYDADSRAAESIRALVGDQGIGISAVADPPTGTVTVQNPYLRLKLFEAPDRVVMSPRSIIGAGLILSSEKHVTVLGQSDSFVLRPAAWKDSIPRHLGLRFSSSPSLLTRPSDFVVPTYYKWTGAKFDLSLEKTISSLFASDFDDIFSAAALLAEGERAMNELPGGAVILGSSTNDPDYTDLVYQSGRKLGARGIPISTGGSGGYMLVANTAAYDSGTHSIGIPLTGRFQLDSEKIVGSKTQTLTVGSDSYHSRIPLLLHHREIIVFAPGGSGTIREMATALVAMARSKGEEENPPELVFLSSQYYGPLVEQLRRALPEPLRGLVHLVDTADDWDPLLDNIEARLGSRIGNLRMAQAPVPRNDRTAFPKPVYEPSRYDDRDRDWLW